VSHADLFRGIAVLIDDQIDDPAAGITRIREQIEKAGCHVVKFSKLPEEGSIEHLREVSFFVLDWRLESVNDEDGNPLTGPAARAVQKLNDDNAIAFLKKLKDVCVAPVFVFTNEVVEHVEQKIKRHPELSWGDDPPMILVKSKDAFKDEAVFDVLSDWMLKAPSVYVLKKWERAYTSAKNELFKDFYTKSVQWPLVLWKTYKSDNVSPSAELGALIARNLLSRMTPFDFDLAPFNDALEALDSTEHMNRNVVLKVLEGERFLPSVRLHGNAVAPGDIFKRGDDYYVNIRPDCDCIARDGVTEDKVEMYLLKGSKVTSVKVLEKLDPKYGTLKERDTECIIFAMLNGTTVCFQFAELLITEAGPWIVDRKGRLLPPYLTRLQQRYAAYLQRPGLSKIPKAALPPLPPAQVTPPPTTPPAEHPKTRTAEPENPATKPAGRAQKKTIRKASKAPKS
jgi:hypothetical protein